MALDRPARELSTGNRQKVGLVLAFMQRPELLILDEPTSGLDPLMQDEFERLVRETVAEGRTVFCPRTSWTRCSDSPTGSRSSDRAAWSRTTPSRACARALRSGGGALSGGRRPQPFAALDGVTVTARDGDRLALQVTEPSDRR